MEDSFAAWLDAVRAEVAAARAAVASPPKDQRPHQREKRLDSLLPMQFEHGGRLLWADRAHRYAMWSAIWTLALLLFGFVAIVCVLLRRWVPDWTWLVLVGLAAVAALVRTIYARLERPGRRWIDEAEVVAGALVYANNVLHRPGPEPASGAGFVFTFDRALAADPARLEAIADRCFELHRPEVTATAAERELQRRARAWSEDRTEDDPHTFDRVQVPRALAGNDATFMTAVGVSRAALPDGVIDRRLYPMLARRDRNESVELVPVSLWPRAGNG